MSEAETEHLSSLAYDVTVLAVGKEKFFQFPLQYTLHGKICIWNFLSKIKIHADHTYFPARSPKDHSNDTLL